MSELIRREDVQREMQVSYSDGAFSWQDGQDLMNRINALPTASPWRSMEDNGPPEENGPYFVYAPSYRGGSSSEKERARGVMISKWTGKHWSIEVGYYKRPGCVTHWMPIEPPKEKGE
jgi:hypothetical protein